MLIDAAELRTLFDIATQIVDVRLTFCIENASRTLKAWVGSDAYDDAGAVDPDEPEDPDRATALKAAESYLAMFHALLNTGARIRKDGLVHREQDAAGPIGGNIVNQFYTPAEMIALRNEYFGQAESFAAPYLVAIEQSNVLGANTITMKGGWATSSAETDL